MTTPRKVLAKVEPKADTLFEKLAASPYTAAILGVAIVVVVFVVFLF